jgi:hypothetical protein
MVLYDELLFYFFYIHITVTYIILCMCISLFLFFFFLGANLCHLVTKINPVQLIQRIFVKSPYLDNKVLQIAKIYQDS